MATKEMPRIFSRSGETITDIKRSGQPKKESTGRDYTYTAIIECDGAPSTECVYVVRGNGGRYEEDLCGFALLGSLVFVEKLDVDLGGGIVIAGWVYNGTDDTGVYGYHFSTSEVPQFGAFTVLIGEEHQAGQRFSAGGGLLATRTSP